MNLPKGFYFRPDGEFMDLFYCNESVKTYLAESLNESDVQAGCEEFMRIKNKRRRGNRWLTTT